MEYTLDFEKPVQDLENQINELNQVNEKPGIDLSSEIKALREKVTVLTREIYSKLTPWERVQLARHPLRPHAVDYIDLLFDDFFELHGDRKFADDPSMIAGFGYFKGQKVAIIAIEKGRKTQDKIKRNFGMASPEGYRKAKRIADMADRFGVPIITLVDTPGAYPGIGAEERGQAEAIADNLEFFFGVSVPIVSVIIGEGGSGGALGIAIADRVLMQEYSVYSVISPESCASILWSDPQKAQDAANSLQLGPEKALEYGVVEEIINEPLGGAHKDYQMAADEMSRAIEKNLKELLNSKDLKKLRYNRFRKIGSLK